MHVHCTCCKRIGTTFSYLNINFCTQIVFNNGRTELLLRDELFLASVVVKYTFFLSIICMSISRPFHLIFSKSACLQLFIHIVYFIKWLK